MGSIGKQEQSSREIHLLSCSSNGRGGSVCLQVCFPLIHRKRRFQGLCPGRGAVLVPSFIRRKVSLGIFQYFWNLQCGYKAVRISGTGETARCFSCHYYIISGRVCFCLKDTVEAIWLRQHPSPSILFINLPLPPPPPSAPPTSEI